MYKTTLYKHSEHSEYIHSIVKDLHVFGHGLERGMSQEEHLHRVLDYMGESYVLAVQSGDTVVGAASIHPALQQDPHFPGNSLQTGFIVIEPGHPGAARRLLKDLRRLAEVNGADYLIVTKRISDSTYITRGFKIGRI